MTFIDKLKMDVSSIFLREFAETVSVGTTNYNAIVTYNTTDEIVGPTVITTAKIACSVAFPYGTIILHNGIQWQVLYYSEEVGLFIHQCTRNERINYRG